MPKVLALRVYCYMIKNIIHSKCKTVTSAAIIIGLAGLVSRFLGIFRDRVLAGTFGAGDTLDIYYAAFRVPDLVFNLLVLGALSAGFIPVFSKYLKRKSHSAGQEKINKEALDLANNVLNIVALFLIILCLLLIIITPLIMPLITPGFSGRKMELTIALTRWMFLSPIFLGLSSIIGGILQSFRRFLAYSLAPIVYNIGIILGAVFFVDWWGIYGLAAGVILGVILHLTIQLPTVLKMGYSYQWLINLRHKGILLIGKLMAPRTFALAITQINLLVITIIASGLEEGSIAVFNLANNLQNFPIGIFGIAYAIAVFPTLADYANEHKREKFIHNISHTLRQILFFIIPFSILFLLLRAQIVRVVLGSGQFDWQDTIRTADVLAFFSLSLFAQSLIPLLARAFYAYHNTMVPFAVGLFSAIINILASLLFVQHFGVAGLALAFSLASIINFALLWLTLRLKLGELDELNIFLSIIKMSAAALLMAVVVQFSKGLLALLFNMEKFWGIFLQGFIAGLAGLLVYFAGLYLLKSPEFFTFQSALVKKLFKTKLPQGGADESRGV